MRANFTHVRSFTPPHPYTHTHAGLESQIRATKTLAVTRATKTLAVTSPTRSLILPLLFFSPTTFPALSTISHIIKQFFALTTVLTFCSFLLCLSFTLLSTYEFVPSSVKERIRQIIARDVELQASQSLAPTFVEPPLALFLLILLRSLQ